MSKDTELVLVDTVSTFRMRYVVEVPIGHKDYALDTVTMKEAKEFSQKYLDELIVSHRVISKDEALAICDEDNEYTKTWSEDQKAKIFITTMNAENDK